MASILVVEDRKRSSETTSHLLCDAGYAVSTAPWGKLRSGYIDRMHPDLLVIDEQAARGTHRASINAVKGVLPMVVLVDKERGDSMEQWPPLRNPCCELGEKRDPDTLLSLIEAMLVPSPDTEEFGGTKP